jgi:flagellar protein FlaJ
MVSDKTFKKILKYIFLTLTIVGFAIALYLIFSEISLISAQKVNLYLVIPAILFLIPYLSLSLYEVKSVASKMEIVPRFFRDIVDSVESGTDLVSSIRSSVKNQYGVLNEDIKKLSNQLSWGVDFEQALLNFADNIGSKDLKRDIRLVIEARRIGGHVEKILRELSYKITTELLRVKERTSNLASNTFTGYISFLIFLGIIILVYNNLFVGLGAQLDGSTPGVDVVAPTGGVPSAGDRILNLYLTLFILLTYELAILSGFLFGLMQENNLIAGAPHVVLLVLMSFVGFFFFV